MRHGHAAGGGARIFRARGPPDGRPGNMARRPRTSYRTAPAGCQGRRTTPRDGPHPVMRSERGIRTRPPASRLTRCDPLRHAPVRRRGGRRASRGPSAKGDRERETVIHRGTPGGPVDRDRGGASHPRRSRGHGVAALERNPGGVGGRARRRRDGVRSVWRQHVHSRRCLLAGRHSVLRRALHRLGCAAALQHRGRSGRDPKHRRGCSEPDPGSHHATTDSRVCVFLVSSGCGGLRRAGGRGGPRIGRARVSSRASRRGPAGGPRLVRDHGNALLFVSSLGDGHGLLGTCPGVCGPHVSWESPAWLPASLLHIFMRASALSAAVSGPSSFSVSRWRWYSSGWFTSSTSCWRALSRA